MCCCPTKQRWTDVLPADPEAPSHATATVTIRAGPRPAPGSGRRRYRRFRTRCTRRRGRLNSRAAATVAAASAIGEWNAQHLGGQDHQCNVDQGSTPVRSMYLILRRLRRTPFRKRYGSARGASSRRYGHRMSRPDRSHGLDHVVVIMFENRSFDNLLGRLYQPGEVASFDGVAGRDLSTRCPRGRGRRPGRRPGWCRTGRRTMISPSPTPGRSTRTSTPSCSGSSIRRPTAGW